MSEARHPILRYLRLRVKPGVSCGTMMFEISRDPSGRFPVTAVIVVPPLISVPEFVMKAFVPLISHFASRSSAFVCTLPASLPALGSVSPKPHNIFPCASGTRYCCF